MPNTFVPEGRSSSARSAARAHLLALREARATRRSARRGAATVSDTDLADQPGAEERGSLALNTDPEAEADGIAAAWSETDTVETAGAEEEWAEANEAVLETEFSSDETIEPPDDHVDEDAPDEQDLRGVTDPFAIDAVEDPTPESDALEGLDEPDGIIPAEATPTDDPPQDEAQVPSTVPTEPESFEPELSPERAPPAQPEQSDLPPGDSPLFQLPGAGPGLVWMLHKAQINTLSELAHSDPAETKRRLGTVGEIVDLNYWIEWAKDQTDES